MFDEGKGLSTEEQQYDPTSIINEVRGHVDAWRALPNPSQWQVTPETARLLQHWRHHKFSGVRPFFCQVEAVETAIWLTEVAPQSQGRQAVPRAPRRREQRRQPGADAPRAEARHRRGQDHGHGDAHRLADDQRRAPPGRASTSPAASSSSRRASRSRTACASSSRTTRTATTRAASWCPSDMLDDVNRAKIVITNYHAFKLRERIELSKGGRALLQGRTATSCNTLETEGQMLQRVMPDLMGMKNILVLNDEAHHCYREKPDDADDEDLKGDERKEAEKNNEAARLWISGLEAVNRKLGVCPRHRPVGHAVLPARLRLRRGHAVPVDDERLLADGRHRVRHRQAAARPGGGEHPRRRDADVPQPLGEHPQGHAEEGARQGGGARPAQAADAPADRARGALRPLREDLRALGEKRHHGAALLHRRLQEHRDLEAGLRLHLRLPPQERGRHRPRSRTAGSRCSATSTSTATRSRARTRCSSTASSSKPAMRSTTTSASMAADEIERFRREIVERTGDARAGGEHHRPGAAPRGHEHRRQARPARRRRSAAWSPSRCSPKAGTRTPSPTSSASAPSARSSSASRSSAARCAASPTT